MITSKDIYDSFLLLKEIEQEVDPINWPPFIHLRINRYITQKSKLEGMVRYKKGPLLDLLISGSIPDEHLEELLFLGVDASIFRVEGHHWMIFLEKVHLYKEKLPKNLQMKLDCFIQRHDA